MAINKKFIHFKTFANFNSQKLSANEQDNQYTLGINGEIQNGSPTILYNSICYIKDTKQQWTHGQLYDCGGTSNTKEPFYFEVSDIERLTNSCFDFSDLINAFKSEQPIFLRFDTTQSLDERYVVPVSMTYNEIYLTLSFIYYDSIYKIDYNVDAETNAYCSTEQTVTIIPINSIYSKPGAGIPKSDLSSDVQTILNNSLTENDIYDDGFIMANGIVDVEDHYYRLPSDTATNPDFTLATKSDVNASLTKPANYQIWYTTTDDSVIEFADTLFDNNQLLSNVYENGKGVITFDRDILSIPAMAFTMKNNLKTIIIPDSVTTIGRSAFASCTSLTNVTIPDSVTTIGASAFYCCHSLTSITIGDGVTTIGERAFWNCNSLTSVTIPDSVTTIGDKAFEECTSLTSVTIGDSVTTIGAYAFQNCINLTSVYCKSTTPPGIYEDTVPFDTNTNLKIYVPIESLETYKNAEGWNEYSNKICSLLDSNSVKTINGESIIGSGDITISGGTSDANVMAVDTGDVIDDVNVEYATTTYVDGLVGDINSVLENIING